ncbi:hypothetical protein ACN20G_28465 (plasmid) [Streptomyces sp. BI20]|uniref:hypothetical protein n=1 Tax=Streptomyces sp. BI20 TaxID=3403460 RepID=UPI003C70DCF0
MRLPNASLRGVIREMGWTYAALATRVNERTRQLGHHTRFDRSSVAHWLRGAHPHDPVPEILCELASHALGRVLTPLDLGLTPTRRPSAETPDPPDVRRAIQDILNRRSRPAAAHALPSTGPTGPTAGPTSPGPVRARAEGFFIAHLEVFGGAGTLPLLSAYLDGLLTPAGPADPRELTHLARALTVLARGQLDQCAFAACEQTLNCAEQLAGQAHDHTARATALHHLSQLAVTRARLADAWAHARNAEEAAAGAPPAIRAHVAAQTAIVLAGRRDPRALAELDRAVEHLAADDTTAPSAPPDPYSPSGPHILHFQRATALRLLGHTEAAHRALDESARLCPAEQVRTTLFTHIERAHVHRGEGDHPAASTALHTAATLNDTVRSPRAARDIGRLTAAIRDEGRATSQAPGE